MISIPELKTLAIESVKNPGTAARAVIALRLDRDILWTALFLAVVLNAILLGIQNMALPPVPGTPVLFTSVPLYLLTVTIGQVVFILTVYLAGRWMGGSGHFLDVMAVLVWLQLLQVVLQVGLVILTFTIPALAVLISMTAMIYGLYILLHFVNEAHRLGSLGRAGGVVFAALIAIAFSLSLVIMMVGGAQLGLSNV